MNEKYRPEIDGLRSIAVMLVLLFHAGINIFKGGYIGVDVFFVLSGYLITNILLKEHSTGKFKIINFYERRARRILPALFLVTSICLVPAWMLMAPHQLKDFSQSLVASSLFSSNILFWLESGYFEASAELKPLLHTWSLGVEEQFYLAYPLMLIALTKLRRPVQIAIVGIVALCSFVLAQWSAEQHPAANFFLIHTRAWELLVGALIGFAETRSESSSSKSSLSWVGLVLIFLAAFFYSEATPYPSAWTLAPVIGTTLIIMYASPTSGAGMILSSPPFVAMGLISYSLYLWHQPILAFFRIWKKEYSLNCWSISAFLLFTLILATLTYHFVEKPFRSSIKTSRSSIFILSFCGIFTFTTIGYWGHTSNGFLSIKLAGVNPRNRGLLIDTDSELHMRTEAVFRHKVELQSPQFSASQVSRKILIVGDSIGEDLATAMLENRSLFDKYEFRFLKLHKECMQGFKGIPQKPQDEIKTECGKELSTLLESPLIFNSDLTVITNLWKSDLDFEKIRDFFTSLKSTSNNVLLLGGGGYLDISSIAYEIAVAEKPLSQEEIDHIIGNSRRPEFDAGNMRIEQIAKELSLKYADRHDLYCQKNKGCRILEADGRSVLFDAAHLTVLGMERTARRIRELGWLSATN